MARDAYVDWRGSRYSVPWSYAGKQVWVREKDSGLLEVHYGDRRIAEHAQALQETLASLSLTALEPRLEGLLEQAAKAEPSYGDFLLDVLTTEGRSTETAVSEDAAAAGAPAVREDLRSVRLQLPAVHR